VHVARLAGVPESVARRAEFLLKSAERHGPVTASLPLFARIEPAEESPIETELAALNPDVMSPREALDALYELRAKLMARRAKEG
jgi:DNA mismatch repair protein MutS